MRNLMRALALSSLVFAAACATTSSAGALTISPSGFYTATSGTVRFSFPSNGQSVTCTASSIGATMASDGTGTIAAGDVVYSGCSSALLGSVSISQSGSGTRTFLLVRNGGIDILIGYLDGLPSTGIVMRSGICQISIGGGGGTGATGVLYGQLLSGASLPGVITPTSGVWAPLRKLGLTTSSTTCSPLFTTAGLAVDVTASYTFGRSITISG